MQTLKVVHVVSCHAEGEVGDVIVGGVAVPPGDTVWAQSRWIASDERLRDFVLNEPRGGVFRHVNLLVPPKDPRADAAWIIMEPADTPPMSGSNAMCVATVLLDTGIVPMREPLTHLVLEAPGGLVEVDAECACGKAQRVSVHNVPSFVDKIGVDLVVPGIGKLVVDTAYGGDSFVLVRASDVGIALTPEHARQLAEVGAKIVRAANEELGFRHPTLDWSHISFCEFVDPTSRVDGAVIGKSAVAIRPGKIDRSPTGTGCSARLAVLLAKGEISLTDTFVGRSIIDTEFRCSIAQETRLGTVRAIMPVVSGRAWITGIHQLMLDPADPFPRGYRLPDTWPMAC